ncbi:MAG: hypothetical protein EOP83_20430 [Verrucomicrobiaceae bacterium]|nr:MAG: hypothetical protein EOP83_20430 [Verrucomicrobiaceae bacterium]
MRSLFALAESGCIYQPVYRGRRDDMDRPDCQVRQLKFKLVGTEISPLVRMGLSHDDERHPNCALGFTRALPIRSQAM